ncbi:Transcription termination factor mitochondrial/chloroplastic [Arabidopsis suecica]|jgi:mTERF domain-containing protein|uniref:Transcription termination factor MTERF2, chloroplastic n=2 Tax=Arabidopsis TaxID=3701 RepID=MTEF2_ARATH|nr:Mitochondrial transcription termination factor family protein [Arabidopsis thaliana]F4IHL3.1 RecName: Full=Transcription termination factor MTERF2, chloroplastic; AltName: Full=Mitochondrial transcription termination factor 2; AltName: Full=Protein EMBRYO DEFECTIVE 2219; Flags: Precursor [Arabidopsis thaliana]AEC07213.1 Mitochondrial transcription termination factor family protein [Arabidopsis thaliana]KAG7641595.1 Transcription termination factor mitochondrial/chloroplastic [Arabidopsis suec|eukprot:NP_179763.3 Mitochondrial transcription termination factor family protein [Arabidopsis thaliana]
MLLHCNVSYYTSTFSFISSSLRRQDNADDSQDTVIRRRHNARSISLYIRHNRDLKLNKNPNESQETFVPPPPPPRRDLDGENRSKLLELSLVTRRTPQFPGSIYAQSASDADIASSLPSLRNFLGSDGDDDGESEREMIVKALEIRRKVTKEIIKESLVRKGRFGITYATNVTDRLGDFVDHVMIQAAALKRLPEFSESRFNLRARTVIEDSNFVPLVRWLKHHELSYNRIAKIICMSKGNLDSIRIMIEWLKSIHVKGEFIAVAFLRSGDNILQRNREELNEIVEYLESNGVRRDWMGYVVGRCPELLSFSMEEVKSRVDFFLKMGMNQNDFGTMVYDYPKIIGFFSFQVMEKKINYLKEFGLSTEEVGRLLAYKPHLMGCSIEERWKPLVKYFYYLGIPKEGMKRILVVKPILYCIDLEKTIAPKVRFLQEMGIPNEAIGNMLVKFPSLLTNSLYKKIRPVVIFLLTRAGVTQKDIGKVIAMDPALLGCSIGTKLEPNMRYYISLGIRFYQLGEMIADFPMLLRYNVDNLRPKYRYLRRTMIRPLQDLIEFPRFFSYSLERRIIPRHTIMVENRVNFKLRYMLACTDEEFERRVRDKVERRERFEAGLDSEDSQPSDENISDQEIAFSDEAEEEEDLTE